MNLDCLWENLVLFSAAEVYMGGCQLGQSLSSSSPTGVESASSANRLAVPPPLVGDAYRDVGEWR